MYPRTTYQPNGHTDRQTEPQTTQNILPSDDGESCSYGITIVIGYQ